MTYEAYGIEDGFLGRMLDLDYVLTPGEEAYIAMHHELEQMEKMLYPFVAKME